MKAIVLTFDLYRSFAEHMISCYADLWPRHPFQFQIPCQKAPSVMETGRVRYHRCPPDIKSTVLTLLEGLDDEEMIYWCIDDKYPIQLELRKIEELHRWLLADTRQGVDGLLFCRCRGMLEDRNLAGQEQLVSPGTLCLERRNYEQIWIHQFVKVKVIRHLFRAFPNEIPVAKMMDAFKDRTDKPESHRLYVTAENLAVFGESTAAGTITKNCFQSMTAKKQSPPLWASKAVHPEVTMGVLPPQRLGSNP